MKGGRGGSKDIVVVVGCRLAVVFLFLFCSVRMWRWNCGVGIRYDRTRVSDAVARPQVDGWKTVA